ncbi:hypothetical protein, partial [Salmonella sp. s29873]|uniref:hypothetical protein n=1 Tax=Salmonella sp. s29873 TaxID=3159634 RepID=UPI00397FB48B
MGRVAGAYRSWGQKFRDTAWNIFVLDAGVGLQLNETAYQVYMCVSGNAAGCVIAVKARFDCG